MPTPAQMRELSLAERVKTDRSNITVEEIDSVLKSFTNVDKNRDLINFWLDVRLEVSNEHS